MAYRLLLASAFVRPESEQNSSRLQTDCDRGRWQSSPNHRGRAQTDIDAAFQVLRSACRISDQRRRADRANSRRVVRCGSIEKSVVPAIVNSTLQPHMQITKLITRWLQETGHD
jgi:hypothetical protein